MALPRFLSTKLPPKGTLSLEGDEARHAIQVLKVKPQATIVLFDGEGGEAEGVVVEVGKRKIEVEIIDRPDTNREVAVPLEVISALPKGDRQKILVDGLVPFGCSRLTPLLCERAVALPSEKSAERLSRYVWESSKQCGRNRVMEIGQPVKLQSLASAPQGKPGGRGEQGGRGRQGGLGEQVGQDGQVDQRGPALRLIAHPYGNPKPIGDLVSDLVEVKSAQVLIGPEGGLTDEECECLQSAGWQAVSLGPRILRIEMAALFVAAWWASQLERH